jgi:hypothetical protein
MEFPVDSANFGKIRGGGANMRELQFGAKIFF